MRWFSRAAGLMDAQRGFLFPWVPVLMGFGIGVYFALAGEPSGAAWLAAGLALGTLGALAAVLPAPARPWLVAPAVVLAGFLLAGARAHLVAAPVLGFRYYGPVEGRIVSIDRSASDRIRLTLDRVVLDRVDPGRTPGRVRISLHGAQDDLVPEPGMVVILTGHLLPPNGPAEPGGYDFRRQAWFDGLGAVGYTRNPVLMLEPPQASADVFFARLRMRMSARIQATIAGQPGAFASALLSGDRSGLTRETDDHLRGSNLYHIVSISGLHMVLLCGAVLGAVRLGLALVPWLALRLPIRKYAAVAALAAGMFYYLLAGREVPAERAYIMVAVMLVAVLFDRRAISLRSVAIAAALIITLRPESVTEPGFQMSFAATVGLVVAFQRLRRAPKLPFWLVPVVTLLISSLVAGAATAPFAAAHFNRFAHYGLVANIVAVPLMSFCVTPAAMLAAVLAPFGLEWIGLSLMDFPLRWLLWVSQQVSAQDGAVSLVPTPPAAVLPLIALGALTLVLWQGRPRYLGLAAPAVAALLWASVERPTLLVSGDGALLGLMTAEGRALSKPKGQGYSAQNWLEGDGDTADQAAAAARGGFERAPGEVRAEVGGLRLRQFSGQGAADRARAACGAPDLLILAAAAPADLPPGCRLLDARALSLTGALSVYLRDGRPVIVTARRQAGERLWMRGLGPAPDLSEIMVPEAWQAAGD